MLNRIHDAIEEVLESLDAGGEQSRQFAGEIETLRQLLGYPRPSSDLLDEITRRQRISRKLRRLAVEAEGLSICLSILPVEQWLD